MTSFLLTKDLAQRAVELVTPAIRFTMTEGVAKRQDLHIVILNPGIPYSPLTDFADAILYQHQFGVESEWEHEYAAIAWGKANLTWRTGLPTHILQLHPQLYHPGDVRHAGSVNHNGIVVACSGVQGYFDAMFAQWIASACEGLCIHNFQTYTGPNAPDVLHSE